MISNFLIVILVQFAGHCNAQTIYCNYAFECASTSIYRASGFIGCDAYRSCDSSQITTAVNSVSCAAGYSCFGTPSLSTSHYGRCTALLSCAYGELYLTDGEPALCRGEKSCSQGTIHSNKNNIIYCDGFGSCKESTIDTIGQTISEGFLSLKNGILESSSTGGIFDFIGAQTGYNATVVCNDGQTCYVNCYDNNCNDLKLIENSGSTIDVTCYYDARYSEACPDGKVLSSFMYEIPSMIDIGEMWLEFNFVNGSGYDPCNVSVSNAIHCDDAGDYNDAQCSTELTNINGPICCSGSSSCANIDVISNYTNITVLNSVNIKNTSIRCDGEGACSGSKLIANNGNIYSTGSSSASGATITATLGYDIICTGQDSCSGSVLSDSKNVYCFAYRACSGTVLSNVADNVYLYGFEAGRYGSVIKNIGGGVYCQGYTSCYDASISNVTGDVYVSGYQSFYDGEIQNVQGTLLAFGYQSLYVLFCFVCFVFVCFFFC